MAQKKAFIAMSGGVDSSVAAYLARQAGFSCIGGTMLLHESSQEAALSIPKNVEDAMNVANRLEIPFYVFDFKAAFRRSVIEEFVRAYENGITPNPCIICNQRIKFGLLLDRALELGCDYVVTGHYACIKYDTQSGRWILQKAVDTSKDQSYFLYGLTQEQLSHIQFPLGSLTKAHAREIAEAQGLSTAKKKDSQDICFIPGGDYLDFMERYTGHSYPCGSFLDLQGNVVGTHKGAVGYTLGQRKGLGLAMGEPVYVCSKDMQCNTVTVGPNDALMHRVLRANDWFWHTVAQLNEPLRVYAKTRSRMSEQPATVYPEENGFVRVVFDEPQRAITPGQAVVLYDGELLVGGGTITEVL